MNGNWENDYAGTTRQEQQDWATCFSREVTAMRTVPGAHFLFDWDVNAGYSKYPLSALYPGNAYVDIVGADAYDFDYQANAPAVGTAASFSTITTAPDGLDAVTNFAESVNKPMSLPEWGTATSAVKGLGDDGAYVTSIGDWVATNDVAFQSYFDQGTSGIISLDSSDPGTLAGYVAAFR